MNLNTQNWKPFYLKKLYNIQMGNGFDKNKLDEDSPEINLVSRVSYNNGVDVKVGRIKGVEPYKRGLVTVALGGSYLGSCFVQEEPFYTGQNVAVMESLYEEMTEDVNRFISYLVRYESKTKYYAFGRELNTHIRTDFDVKLPIQYNSDGTPVIDGICKYSDEGYVPDWRWIKEYIKSLKHKPLTTKNKSGKAPDLKVNEWKEFIVGKVFNVETTNFSIKDELLDGVTPFISRTAENNGCDGYVDIEESRKTKGCCITIGAEGIYSFFQPTNFATGNKVYSLRNTAMNVRIAMFVCTLLNKEDYRYSYGRARIKGKLENEVIKLPIQQNPDGTPLIDDTHEYSEKGYVPDWRFMEKYIESLPYGDRL